MVHLTQNEVLRRIYNIQNKSLNKVQDDLELREWFVLEFIGTSYQDHSCALLISHLMEEINERINAGRSIADDSQT